MNDGNAASWNTVGKIYSLGRGRWKTKGDFIEALGCSAIPWMFCVFTLGKKMKSRIRSGKVSGLYVSPIKFLA